MKPAGVGPTRTYRIDFGAWDHVAWEVEWQSLADYERLGAEWTARITPDWWKRWRDVTENGGGNEMWTLVE